MTQTPQREPAEGTGAPADDGGHVGAYTVPSDVMDQSSPVDARARQDRKAASTPGARIPLIMLLVVVLLVVVVAWLTLRAGL